MFLLYFIGGWSRSACLICSSRRSLISIPPHSANQLTKKLPCLSWLLLSPICSRAISPLNGRLSGVTPTHQPHTLPPKKSSTVFILPSESLQYCRSVPCDFRVRGMVDGIRQRRRSLLALIRDQNSVFLEDECLYRGGGGFPGDHCCLGPPLRRHPVNSAPPPDLRICKQVQVATRPEKSK